MKAILVVDVEEYGDYYVDVYEKYAGDRFDDKFKGRYYLKPMPKQFGIDVEDDYAKGWNDCIKEITE